MHILSPMHMMSAKCLFSVALGLLLHLAHGISQSNGYSSLSARSRRALVKRGGPTALYTEQYLPEHYKSQLNFNQVCKVTHGKQSECCNVTYQNGKLTVRGTKHILAEVDDVLRQVTEVLNELNIIDEIEFSNINITALVDSVLYILIGRNTESLIKIKLYKCDVSANFFHYVDFSELKNLQIFQLVIPTVTNTYLVSLLNRIPATLKQLSLGDVECQNLYNNGSDFGKAIARFKNLELLHIYYFGGNLLLSNEFMDEIREMTILNLMFKDTSWERFTVSLEAAATLTGRTGGMSLADYL